MGNCTQKIVGNLEIVLCMEPLLDSVVVAWEIIDVMGSKFGLRLKT